MANDNKSQSGKAMVHDSLNSVSNLKFGNEFTKSFIEVGAIIRLIAAFVGGACPLL